MILDNQAQKDFLLEIVSKIIIKGTYSQVKEITEIIDKHLESIRNAELFSEGKGVYYTSPISGGKIY